MTPKLFPLKQLKWPVYNLQQTILSVYLSPQSFLPAHFSYSRYANSLKFQYVNKNMQ